MNFGGALGWHQSAHGASPAQRALSGLALSGGAPVAAAIGQVSEQLPMKLEH